MSTSFAQDSRYPSLTRHSPTQQQIYQASSVPVERSSSFTHSIHNQVTTNFPPRTSSQQSSHQSLHSRESSSSHSPSSIRYRSSPVPNVEAARLRATSTSSQSSVKRKPLPLTAAVPAPSRRPSQSSLASSFSTVTDHPACFPLPDSCSEGHEPFRDSQPPLPDDFAEKQRQFSDPDHQNHLSDLVEYEQTEQKQYLTSDRNQTPIFSSFPCHERLSDASFLRVSSYPTDLSTEGEAPIHTSSRPAAMFTTKHAPPQIDLPAPEDAQMFTNVNKSLPKSPGSLSRGSKLGSFFGWGSERTNPLSPETSPVSDIAQDKEYMPVQPLLTVQTPIHEDYHPEPARTLLGGIDTVKANNSSYFDAYLQTPGSVLHIDEMEDELRAISTELAISIRREMELEDLVERMHSETGTTHILSKRTSDYFSDAGTSSRSGFEVEDVERIQRKAEREKAQLRLDLTDRVNEERSRRKTLEAQIQSLESRAAEAEQQLGTSSEVNERYKDLEDTCEDLRRRLNEERLIKENFEDLLTALKSDLLHSHDERDNLRDEVIPQLRARIEGLETEAAEHEQRHSENARLQKEIDDIKYAHTVSTSARSSQGDLSHQLNKFDTISEIGMSQATKVAALSRSNTVAGRGRKERSMASLSRSASIKGLESRDVLTDRVKDIEAQRDALHRALKSLLERQEHQNRIHATRIKQLEMERDRCASSSPRRYDREVESLRHEINVLRRRADDAIQQKWQSEKGLVGLKMDLERAEQEITSLKKLLAESSPKAVGNLSRSNSVTSHSLERAYADLQAAQARSLEQVKQLDARADGGSAALHHLESALDHAVSERDSLQKEAVNLQDSNSSLRTMQRTHAVEEQALAEDLRLTAQRVEDLAIQVKKQLATNASLRARLVETIEHGEKQQKSNVERVLFMQERLTTLEEELLLAQQHSEERIAGHEEEVKNLTEGHSSQLLRIRDGLRSPRVFSPKSPLLPLFTGTSAKLPRLAHTTSGPGISLNEKAQVNQLRARVEELEKALEDADSEMEEVVGRMNSAQVEVMELWNEREEAVRKTRKLEQEVAKERKKGFLARVRTVQS